MLEQAGIMPIPSAIGKGWRCLEPVQCGDIDARIVPEILRQLRQPRTFALLQGPLGTGYLWWDNGWVWERWHWSRWPVDRARGTLDEIAARVGASTALVTDSF